MPDAMSPAPPEADGADRPERGHRILIAMASSGRWITARISERLENQELAANTPILVLSQLAVAGPLRPRDLLEAAHLTSGGMTKQLDHLESLGLIERRYGALEDDRRATVISLTPEGARVADLIAQVVEEDLDGLRSVVDRLAALLED